MFCVFFSKRSVSVGSIMSLWLKIYGSVPFSNQTLADFSNFYNSLVKSFSSYAKLL